MLDLTKIDGTWTLFLDRDGVINQEKDMDYIYNFHEFRFYDGVLEALKILSGVFSKMFVVTNQRGVEKNLMSEDDLKDLHTNMLKEIEGAGGRLDAIYYCTSLMDDHPNRKPQPGMAYLAKQSFPDIDFSKSIMVGNKLSDMLFGRNAGMYTVYVQTTNPEVSLPDPAIDLAFKDLPAFADSIRKKTDKVLKTLPV